MAIADLADGVFSSQATAMLLTRHFGLAQSSSLKMLLYFPLDFIVSDRWRAEAPRAAAYYIAHAINMVFNGI